MLFILENITTNCQMDASEFQGMLYTMLSEEPFANHILGMTDGNEESTIYDYLFQIFPSQLEIHGHVLLVKPKDLPKYLRTYH